MGPPESLPARKNRKIRTAWGFMSPKFYCEVEPCPSIHATVLQQEENSRKLCNDADKTDSQHECLHSHFYFQCSETASECTVSRPPACGMLGHCYSYHAGENFTFAQPCVVWPSLPCHREQLTASPAFSFTLHGIAAAQ